MRRLNVTGLCVIKHRHKRRWTQTQLAEKLQRLGCDITPQILANIEVGRTPVIDGQIVFFARVFEVNVAEMFPEQWRVGSQMKGLAENCPTRRPRRSRFED
jgi:hypothetical protein